MMRDYIQAGQHLSPSFWASMPAHPFLPSPFPPAPDKMADRKEPPFYNDHSTGSFQYKIPMYETMELFIETLTGTCFELRVSSYEAILSVKSKIQRLEGTTADASGSPLGPSASDSTSCRGGKMTSGEPPKLCSPPWHDVTHRPFYAVHSCPDNLRSNLILYKLCWWAES